MITTAMTMRPAATPSTDPGAGGRLIGTLVVDRDRDHTLLTRRPLGEPSGWATIDDALQAMQQITWGNDPAGVVLEADGRFYGAQLMTNDWRGRPEGAWRNGKFDTWWRNESAVRFHDPKALAIVDGPLVYMAPQPGADRP